MQTPVCLEFTLQVASRACLLLLCAETCPCQLKPGHLTRDQLVAHAFLLLVAGNATRVCGWSRGLFQPSGWWMQAASTVSAAGCVLQLPRVS
jgi:hypothetical protein